MSKFNIGDKVVSKNSPCFSGKVGILVGIDIREDVYGKYLVKINSLDKFEGLAYEDCLDENYCIIEPYDGYATWLNELIKAEDECEENE